MLRFKEGRGEGEMKGRLGGSEEKGEMVAEMVWLWVCCEVWCGETVVSESWNY